MKVKVDAESDQVEKRKLIAEWEHHKVLAESTYQKLNEDAAYAKAHADTEMLTFDLEKSLPTPVLSTGVVYYKRQLWMYNQGIHDCSTNKATMYMWNESVASRGSQEVGSCLLAHLQEMNTTATNLTVYSDACGGQNRNINLACMWMHIVASSDYSFTTVDHKFMISGHSFLPNDRDFAHVELARKKNEHIFVPSDWERVVAHARRKNPFQVRKMTSEDFCSLQPLVKAIVNRKVNSSKEKVKWLKMHWIRVKKERPFEFRYRYTINPLEPWKIVNVKRRSKGRPTDLGRTPLPELYPGKRQISVKKLADLKELLQFIPPIHHEFYQSLEDATTVESNSESEECSEED